MYISIWFLAIHICLHDNFCPRAGYYLICTIAVQRLLLSGAAVLPCLVPIYLIKMGKCALGHSSNLSPLYNILTILRGEWAIMDRNHLSEVKFEHDERHINILL